MKEREMGNIFLYVVVSPTISSIIPSDRNSKIIVTTLPTWWEGDFRFDCEMRDGDEMVDCDERW